MCSSTTWGRSPSSSCRSSRTTTGWLTSASVATSRRRPRRLELVGHLVGAEHLHHDGGVRDLVEGQVGLVRRAPAEQPHRGQLVGDRVSLAQVPAVVLAHGQPPGGGRCRQPRVSLRERSLVWLLRVVARPVAAVPRPVVGQVAAAAVAVAAHAGVAAVGAVRRGLACRCWVRVWPCVRVRVFVPRALVSSSSSSATRTTSWLSSSRLSTAGRRSSAKADAHREGEQPRGHQAGQAHRSDGEGLGPHHCVLSSVEPSTRRLPTPGEASMSRR